MLISISEQSKLIMFSIMAGGIIGILFDIYRLIRGYETPNKIVTFIEDLLFWILTAVVIFVFLLLTSYVYIGPYVYLCILFGIYIYIKLISKVFIRIQTKVIRALGKFIRVAINAVFYLIELIFYNIKQKNK